MTDVKKRTKQGYRCGDFHHRASLTDEDVTLMRELYEEHGVKVCELAKKFEANYYTVDAIVKYRSRVAGVGL